MYNFVEQSFFSSPLEQFKSTIIAKIAYYRKLNERFSDGDLQSFELVNYTQDFYEEYLSAFSGQSMILFVIFFYAFFIFVGKALGLGFSFAGVNKTFLPSQYIIYAFWKGILYVSFFVNFTIAATEVTYMDYGRFVYHLGVMKYSHILFEDVLLYAASVFFIAYVFTRQAEYYDKVGAPFLVPNTKYHYVLESFHKITVDMLRTITSGDHRSQRMYNIVYLIFFFLLITNLQGMIPFSYTLTAHLINTFCIALGVFIYIIYLIFHFNDKNHFLSLFLPSGTPLALSFLLIPIELVSYFFRVISLSVRLFANMMAGHTLLKVILGFVWTIAAAGEAFYLINLIPLLILMILTVLELGVAMIQAYIFSILTCIYLKDAFEGH